MRTAKLTTHSSWMDFRDVLRDLQPFKTSGALRGERHDPMGPMPFTGNLPTEYHNDLRGARVDYVVYSYATPIAWHDQVTGEWTVPDTKYSVTTSRHQTKIRTAVSN